MKDFPFDLHLVTDRPLSRGRSLLEIVRAAVAGGVSVVQLREKEASTRDFVELARVLCHELKGQGIPLLINDRVDIALAVGADGVHLGQNDTSYAMARALLGPHALIGLSVESLADARKAEKLAVAYLGLSPVFATASKSDIKEPLGLAGIRAIRGISRHPLIAIGGVHAGNIREILAAGADGVAVISAICAADAPAQASRELRQEITRSRDREKQGGQHGSVARA